MSRATPWWAVLSSALAPILLIGGWSVAAARQPAGFRSTRDTISALASLGATDRWVMTVCFVGVGLCHLTTAAGLRVANGPGRLLLALGGVAVILVAAFPQPAIGSSVAHQVVAGISFVALALWPALAWRRSTQRPTNAGWALRPTVSVVAAAVLLALDGWFAVRLNGPDVGLAERFAAGAQSLWPFVVVLGTRVAQDHVDHERSG